MSEILKKYVCKNPFNYIDIQTHDAFVCCPSWCTKSIKNEETNIFNWESDSAVEIRKSVLDGSYTYCDKNLCPNLNGLINSGIVSEVFMEKQEFMKKYEITSIDDVEKMTCHPDFVLFGFDFSCNFRCPSCRKALIRNDEEDSEQYIRKMEILKLLEERHAKHIKYIMITGSGDPFYSKIYRDYLINFDDSKYEKLEEIKIITNGRLLTQNMWESLNAKKYIKHIEISIDAASKDTYQSVTRLGGDWDILMRNLKFISTLKTIKYFTASFVVSELNFKEMELFYEMISSIFKKSQFEFNIFYSQHVYWTGGAYTPEQVKKISVFTPGHKDYKNFMDILNRINKKPNVNHNFHHLLL